MRSSPYRARKRTHGTENVMPSRRPRLEIQKGSVATHGKMHRRSTAASCQENVRALVPGGEIIEKIIQQLADYWFWRNRFLAITVGAQLISRLRHHGPFVSTVAVPTFVSRKTGESSFLLWDSRNNPSNFLWVCVGVTITSLFFIKIDSTRVLASSYYFIRPYCTKLGGPQNRSLVMCRYNKRGVLTNIVTGLANIRRALPVFIRNDDPSLSGHEGVKCAQNFKWNGVWCFFCFCKVYDETVVWPLILIYPFFMTGCKSILFNLYRARSLKTMPA